MHFTYFDETPTADLKQGDVLQRTAELDALLATYHPHYNSKSENTHFIILTQSCDLVRRDETGCSARYITIAPIRTLRTIIHRELKTKCELEVAGKSVSSARSRSQIEMLLQRVFNNNEEEYFFLLAEPTKSLAEDSCAVLRLAISLRAEHYETFYSARILQLNEMFRAKLGFLIGRIYSRVGTEDWKKEDLNKKVQENIGKSTVWLNDVQLKKLRNLITQHETNFPGVAIDENTFVEMLAVLKKTRKDEVMERIEAIAEQKASSLSPAEFTQLMSALRADQILTTHLK